MIRFFKIVFILLVGLALAGQASAWPSALDFSSDNNGDGDRKTIPASNVAGVNEDIPRCDAGYKYDIGGLVIEDPFCHRYGLVWAPAVNFIDEKEVMQQQIDWNPELDLDADDEFRLPTIKELIRLVDYDTSDSSRGFTDNLIQYWLVNKCDDSDGDSVSCLQQNVTLASGGVALKDGYLISSTYTDVDGQNSNGFGHILGLRISDGMVVMFEAGPKGATFTGHPNKAGMLALCLGLLSSSNADVTGGCDYRVENDDGDNAAKHAADLATVPVFALLVKEIETP